MGAKDYERLIFGYVFLEKTQDMSDVLTYVSAWPIKKNFLLSQRVLKEVDGGLLEFKTRGTLDSLKEFFLYASDFIIKPDILEKYSWLKNIEGVGPTKEAYNFAKKVLTDKNVEFFSSFKAYAENKYFMKTYADPSSPFSIEG